MRSIRNNGRFQGGGIELEGVDKLADELKGVHLQWDVHAALERLYRT